MLKILTAIIYALCLAVSTASFAGEYTLGVVPQFEARILHARWQPFLDELGRKTGNKFVLVGVGNIPEFEQALNNGEYDFVYMNPWHAVVANESQGYQPIIKDCGRKLTGILVIKEGSPIQGVAELDGREIALPAPNALGASLLMRADLKTLFNLDITPVYVGTHSSVYLNVALGGTPAGGGVYATLMEQPEAVRKQLKVLYETRPMNPHPIGVNPRVPHAVAEAVAEEIVNIGLDDERKGLLEDIPLKEACKANLDDYLMLKEWGLRDFYVQK